jgi:transcriptional regulator with XRE-family HTH domain
MNSTLSDAAILTELGRRLRRQRLDLNISQAELAREAGVSAPTVQRLETGSSVQLRSLVRLLRALDLLDRLEALLPAPGVRPMELLERGEAVRQRASSRRTMKQPKPWEWGD